MQLNFNISHYMQIESYNSQFWQILFIYFNKYSKLYIKNNRSTFLSNRGSNE